MSPTVLWCIIGVLSAAVVGLLCWLVVVVGHLEKLIAVNQEFS